MKKTILFSAIVLMGIPALKAQDQPHYSFYNLQQTIINPAAMGTFDMVNGAAIFNTSLVGYKGAPVYGLIDVNAPVGKTGLHLGGQIQYDKIGVTNRSYFALNIAYRLNLNMKHFLCFGMNGSMQLFNGNYADLNVQQDNDPAFSQNIRSVISPNFKLAMYYFSDNVYLGFTVGNLLVNKLRFDQAGGGNQITVDPIGMHYYLQGGWQKKIGTRWKFQPSAMIRYVHGSPLQIDINAQFLFKECLGFGMSYRTRSTLVVQVNYTVKKAFQIAYACSFGLSSRDPLNFHCHELMLAFRIKPARQMLPIDVPRF